MLTRIHEYQTVDKSDWGTGLWQQEPDKVQYRHEETGYPALAVRHPSSGHWCGYVGVPANHPDFGAHYDTVDVDVYGGLTFSDTCDKELDPAVSICHRPEEGAEDDIWWFGFDCAHWQDLRPGYIARLRFLQEREPDITKELFKYIETPPETYRPLFYVESEIERLAEQLKEREA